MAGGLIVLALVMATGIFGLSVFLQKSVLSRL
jgi:hypothetical protein